MSSGARALEQLLTLIGQNTINLDALMDLLVKKGVITEQELDQALETAILGKHDRGITAAEWARRHTDDPNAMDAFFRRTSQ